MSGNGGRLVDLGADMIAILVDPDDGLVEDFGDSLDDRRHSSLVME